MRSEANQVGLSFNRDRNSRRMLLRVESSKSWAIGGDTKRSFSDRKSKSGLRQETTDAMKHISAAELNDLFEEVEFPTQRKPRAKCCKTAALSSARA